jgi:beta-N-acetylhexosaminidase
MDAQRGIARRTVIGLPRDGLNSAWEKDFSTFPPAGVLVFRRDFKDLEDLRRLTARLRELARPKRLFITVDEEGGFVSQLSGHLTVPPNAMLLARGAAPGDIEWASRVTAERLRAVGIDWVFAPVADIHSEPRNPVIGPRAYGTDPEQVARRVAEALRGFRAGGVASCLKHFPGHGDTVVDSHLGLPRLDLPLDRLERRELVPFRANLDADSVMTAHLVVSGIDADRPATFSPAIAQQLLRKTLGFQGVSITDALEMKGASSDASELGAAARRALGAGCDVLLFAFHDESLRRLRGELARELEDGAIERAGFDAARPRLERLDREHPEPTARELQRPLDSLTPPDWEERLERIIERGIQVDGALASAARGPWRLLESDAAGASMSAELAKLGVSLVQGEGAAAQIAFVSRRTPLPADDIERLRVHCHERPTILVGLQNDAFLAELPEAALRISAADSTPLTCRVVARILAGRIGVAA